MHIHGAVGPALNERVRHYAHVSNLQINKINKKSKVNKMNRVNKINKINKRDGQMELICKADRQLKDQTKDDPKDLEHLS